MKLALTLLALLFVGVIGAHFLIEDRGQVLVTIRGYTLETTVPVLVLMLVLAYATLRLVVRIWRIPRNVGRAAAAIRERRSRENLTKGLLALQAGDWALAERLLGRTAHDSDAPLLHYLGAARAAEQLGASERRDRWLALANEQKGAGEAAVLLAQAEALLTEGQYEQALAALRTLDEVAPNQPPGLALQARACEQLGDWSALCALLPRLRSARALPVAAIDALEARAQARALALAGLARDAEAVRKIWRSLSRDLTSRIEVVRAYTRALQDAGDVAGAEEAIRQALGAQWDTELVRQYGELATGDAAKQLKRVEGWLESHPGDAALLLAAARLCLRNELWGKARTFLEASLALEPNVEAYHLYGKLLEQLGERDRAADVFRNGLALATGEAPAGAQLPRLPAPTS